MIEIKILKVAKKGEKRKDTLYPEKDKGDSVFLVGDNASGKTV